MKTTIVLSGVNLRRGGTLTILQSCLKYLSQLAATGDYRIIAVVHQRSVADYPHIQYIELPWSTKSWGHRLWCEYVTMHRLSLELAPIHLWLSLHDTTPRVVADRQAVYCQTSFPFLQWKLSDLRFNIKIPLFAMFTQYAYRINVHRNRYLIVQQAWLRRAFSQMLHMPEEIFIISPPQRKAATLSQLTAPTGIYTFCYPATADCHKNFEVICKAAVRLEQRIGTGRFLLRITLSGHENTYARSLYKHYKQCSSIQFDGYLDQPALQALYASSHCLLFPSRIETWGLPISEFQPTGRPMLLSDLPYAHETAAGAPLVAYIDPQDPNAWCNAMESLVKGRKSPCKRVPITPPAEPVSKDWAALFKLLLS